MQKQPLRDAYVQALERENDDLRLRIVELERQIGIRTAVPLIFGLTASEARIFSMLVERGSANKEQLLIACTNDITGNNPPEIKIVDVYICKIRKKIEKFGIAIETVWGRGYNMSPEDRAKVRAYLDATVGVPDGTVQQHASSDGRLHAAGS